MVDHFSIIIFGGVVHVGCPLLLYLLTLPKVTHIRLADRYLITPTTSTTFVDPSFLSALSDPRVEYIQANLSLPTNLSKVYTTPTGGSYDIVFDLTGEGLLVFDVSEELLLERTAKLARSLAQESAKRGVKAHVRDTLPFLTVDPSAPASKEGDTPFPRTTRAYWWYEAGRAAASVPNLKTAITRSAQVLGPFQYHSTAANRFTLAKLYKYTGEKMKWLWGPELRIHTISSQDWCEGAVAVAFWLLNNDATIVNEQLPPVKMKPHSPLREEAQGLCPRDVTPSCPVFNLVDNNNTTQGDYITLLSEYFGIQSGYANAAINAWAKISLGSVVNEANQTHAELMAEMFKKLGWESKVIPFSSFMDKETLDEIAQSWISAGVWCEYPNQQDVKES